MLTARSPARVLPLHEERRRHQRVRIDLLGRLMLENRQEYPCRIINMSPGGAAVMADTPGRVGERVIPMSTTLAGLRARSLANSRAGSPCRSALRRASARKARRSADLACQPRDPEPAGRPPPRPCRSAQPKGPPDPAQWHQYHLPRHRHFPVRRRGRGTARATAADRICDHHRQDPGTCRSPHRRRFRHRVHPFAAPRFCGRERHRRVNAGSKLRPSEAFFHAKPQPIYCSIPPFAKVNARVRAAHERALLLGLAR